MLSNTIFSMQAGPALAKKVDNKTNESKSRTSQSLDFKNIMSEANKNIKSNNFKKVAKNYEGNKVNNNKQDFAEDKKRFNENGISINKEIKEMDDSKNNMKSEELNNKETTKESNELNELTVQIESIINILNVILNDENSAKQEPQTSMSLKGIEELGSLLEKMNLLADENNLVQPLELENTIKGLKDFLLDEAAPVNTQNHDSIAELKTAIQKLINAMDDKNEIKDESINVEQINETKSESIAFARTQDATKLITNNKSNADQVDNEVNEVKSEKDGTIKDNQKAKIIDEKVQGTEKAGSGKLIQKVLQKVIIEPKDSIDADIKLNNSDNKGIEKINLVAKSTPSYKMEVLKQIVERAHVTIGDNMSEMDMQLKPDNLGKLSLKLVIEKGLMSARFIAESQQVKEIIESNFNQLKDMLEQKGINVQSFSVSVGQQDQNFNDNNGYQAWKESIVALDKSKAPINFEDDITDEILGTRNPYQFHDGTVDYKA